MLELVLGSSGLIVILCFNLSWVYYFLVIALRGLLITIEINYE